MTMAKTHESTESQSGQATINHNLFSTDEFRIYCMKVLPCSKRFVHDWTTCPFAHPGEKAKRRDPRTHQYDCEMCPAVVKGETCELGAACPHSHHVFESWLHPQKYRTLLCKDGDHCLREDTGVCFFAHGTEQLRTTERQALCMQPQQQQQSSAASGAVRLQQQPASPQSSARSRRNSSQQQHLHSSSNSNKLPGAAADLARHAVDARWAAAGGAAAASCDPAMPALSAQQQQLQQLDAGHISCVANMPGMGNHCSDGMSDNNAITLQQLLSVVPAGDGNAAWQPQQQPQPQQPQPQQQQQQLAPTGPSAAEAAIQAQAAGSGDGRLSELCQLFDTLVQEVRASKQEAEESRRIAAAAQQQLHAMGQAVGGSLLNDVAATSAAAAPAPPALEAINPASANLQALLSSTGIAGVGAGSAAPAYRQLSAPSSQAAACRWSGVLPPLPRSSMDSMEARRNSFDDALLLRAARGSGNTIGVSNVASSNPCMWPLGQMAPGSLPVAVADATRMQQAAATPSLLPYGVAMGDAATAADFQQLLSASIPSATTSGSNAVGEQETSGGFAVATPSLSSIVYTSSGGNTSGSLAFPGVSAAAAANIVRVQLLGPQAAWGSNPQYSMGLPSSGTWVGLPEMSPLVTVANSSNVGSLLPGSLAESGCDAGMVLGAGGGIMSAPQLQSDYLLQLQQSLLPQQDASGADAAVNASGLAGPVSAPLLEDVVYHQSMPATPFTSGLANAVPGAVLPGSAAGFSGDDSSRSFAHSSGSSHVSDARARNPIGGAKQLGWF